MHLERKHPGGHTRVVVHDGGGLFGQYAFVAQAEVPPTVLPDNAQRTIVAKARARLEDYGAIGPNGLP